MWATGAAIATKGVDLSVGAVMAISGAVAAVMVTSGLPVRAIEHGDVDMAAAQMASLIGADALFPVTTGTTTRFPAG